MILSNVDDIKKKSYLIQNLSNLNLNHRLQTCHLIYANKSYIIEREDNQWRKDLDECRQFLRENGY